jgi:hypothetical protein
MDEDVSDALDQLKDNLPDVVQNMIKQADDDNTKTFEGVAKVTDDLTAKLTDALTKLDDVTQKVTAIQDYLRVTATALMTTPAGAAPLISPTPW